jgi:hypothetical protein
MLLKAESKAIEMFNSAVKECINLNLQPTKENAKELLLFKLMSIKESLLNTCILDNVPKQAIENTLNYYLKINTLIENL